MILSKMPMLSDFKRMDICTYCQLNQPKEAYFYWDKALTVTLISVSTKFVLRFDPDCDIDADITLEMSDKMRMAKSGFNQVYEKK